MSDKPILTRPLSDDEKFLREKFYESITVQSDLMDKLSEHLITLELAIQGVYATALRLVGGDKAILTSNIALYVTFACWFLALLLALIALLPRNWTVNLTILRQNPKNPSQ